MTTVDPVAVAALLDAAHTERRTLDVSTVAVGDLLSAYAVQRELTSLRLSRGDAVVGWKLGYTTRAMRDQMGIDAPNLGPLLASMRVEPGGLATGIHPRVEPEIAFVMARDPGPDPSAQEVLDAVAEVRLALEVVDSVWTGYRFDLEHNTADGSSAHGFVLGGVLPPGADVVEVQLRGSAAGPATGVGRVGDAAESSAWLSRELGMRGLSLRPGDVVLTGGLTAAAPLEGAVEAVAASLGVRVEVRG